MPPLPRLPLIGNTLVVNEDSCNLGCAYCLTGRNNLTRGQALASVLDPPERDRYTPSSGLGRRIDRIAGRLRGHFDLPLLKVTGGEAFLVRGIMDFLEEQSAYHEVLVIQTNGVLISEEQLARLRSWGNAVLQISLDSHLHPGNSYRVRSRLLHRTVVEAVTRMLDSGLPVEVHCVLNDRSVVELDEFAAWLAGFATPPTLFPFPVRGTGSGPFKVRPEQVRHIEELAGRHRRYRHILPPLPYFDRLLDFCRRGGRAFRCHLPRLVVSTFSDGVITPCPNIWFTDVGNALARDADRSLAGLGTSGLYRELLAPSPRVDACHDCFTPWDTLSLYFEDEITLDQLCAAPTYAPPRVRELIRAAKATYRRGAGE
ncbi:radical SAM protein [Streptomyces sp. NPDC003077]|uniref:radical SAM protein n=1 Tax=Streptomyces sp. NPDC003077 TaxID=3154443 RepID=UPI0033A36AC3